MLSHVRPIEPPSAPTGGRLKCLDEMYPELKKQPQLKGSFEAMIERVATSTMEGMPTLHTRLKSMLQGLIHHEWSAPPTAARPKKKRKGSAAAPPASAPSAVERMVSPAAQAPANPGPSVTGGSVPPAVPAPLPAPKKPRAAPPKP